MKILILTDKFPNAAQPGRTMDAKYRAQHLARLCEVKVVAPVPYFPPLRIFKKWYVFSQIPREEQIDSIEIFHPRYLFFPVVGRPIHGFVYFMRVLPFLWRLKRRFDFDLIDAQWTYPDGYAAVLLGRLFKVPVTIRTLGSDVHTFRDMTLIRRFVKYALMKCDKVFTVCEALKTLMVDMGIPSEKVRVLYNGINSRLFYPGRSTGERKRLVFAGWLTQNKGVLGLSDAFAQLLQNNQNVELIYVGTGEVHKILQKKIESLGIADKARILGHRPHEEVAEQIRMSDLLILPSMNEGLPNVIIEALFCHVPVVASEVGGIPEATAYGKYGVLVKPGDPEALAAGIQKALDTKWDFSDVDKHLSQFSWELNAQRTLEEFAALIGKEKST